MLFSYLGVYIDQDEIVEAAGVGDKLKIFGMTVFEMKLAVKNLYPYAAFWFKPDSSLRDLTDLISEYHFPVGIEWQGVFYEDDDEDNGHYGVITHIDTANNVVMVADPYKRFAGVDRRFPVLEFEDRWWDENEVRDKITGKTSIVREDKMAFVITPEEASFPELLGMVKG